MPFRERVGYWASMGQLVIWGLSGLGAVPVWFKFTREMTADWPFAAQFGFYAGLVCLAYVLLSTAWNVLSPVLREYAPALFRNASSAPSSEQNIIDETRITNVEVDAARARAAVAEGHVTLLESQMSGLFEQANDAIKRATEATDSNTKALDDLNAVRTELRNAESEQATNKPLVDWAGQIIAEEQDGARLRVKSTTIDVSGVNADMSASLHVIAVLENTGALRWVIGGTVEGGFTHKEQRFTLEPPEVYETYLARGETQTLHLFQKLSTDQVAIQRALSETGKIVLDGSHLKIRARTELPDSTIVTRWISLSYAIEGSMPAA